MGVQILYFDEFRDITGVRSEVLEWNDGDRLKDLFACLQDRYGTPFMEQVKLAHNTVLVDGRFYGLVGGEEAVIEDNNTICFLPIMHGG